MRRALVLVAVLLSVPALAKPKYQDGLFLRGDVQYYSGPVGGLGLGWNFQHGYTLSGSYLYGELDSVSGTTPFGCRSVPFKVGDRRQSGFGLTFTVPLSKR